MWGSDKHMQDPTSQARQTTFQTDKCLESTHLLVQGRSSFGRLQKRVLEILGPAENVFRTYLGFCGGGLIVAVGSSTKRGARSILTGSNTSTLCKVLFSLGLSNLDLLFLATTTQLLRLEGVLGLELRPTMLGDVSLRHCVDVFC